jgi:hypothetical protein
MAAGPPRPVGRPRGLRPLRDLAAACVEVLDLEVHHVEGASGLLFPLLVLVAAVAEVAREAQAIAPEDLSRKAIPIGARIQRTSRLPYFSSTELIPIEKVRSSRSRVL